MNQFAVTNLGEVELQGVVGGQRHDEAPGQVLRQGVTVVAEEQAVVAKGRHGDANLSQVVQVLQHWGLEGRRRQRLVLASTWLAFILASLLRASIQIGILGMCFLVRCKYVFCKFFYF